MPGIVVGVDGSEIGALALAWAAREAELRDLPLTAVMAWSWLDQRHAAGDESFDPSYGEAEAATALGVFVDQALGAALASDVEQRAVCDLAARALIEASAGAALLVVGARGLGGFRGLLLGSVSRQVLHNATCPVAVVREGEQSGEQVERIVVGIDTSETARQALLWAAEEARVREAALRVVHVWHLPFVGAAPFVATTVDHTELEQAARRVLDDAIAGLDTDGMAHPVEGILAGGGAAGAILEAAQGAAVVVVGSRGKGGFKGLVLGSVSHQIAHHADCPVVVIPAAES